MDDSFEANAQTRAPCPSPIISEVWRGPHLESVHRASWVVLEEDRVLASGGNGELCVYPRSSLKPFQLLPLFADPGFEGLGLDPAARAILVASHSSDERHIAAVQRVLTRAGAGESALACGPHDPMDREAAIRLRTSGTDTRAIHNNCSGKHAGFLLSARRLGAPLESYLDPEHPVQREVVDVLAELGGLARSDFVPGSDGCGAPNWPMPLPVVAGLFRDLANPERLPERYRSGAQQIFRAVHAEPHFLAGRGRFGTALIRASQGSLIGKCGAEGYFAIGIRAARGRPAMGIAVKVEDGAKRAYESALPVLLTKLGLLERTDDELAPFRRGIIRNTRGRDVGRIVGRWDGIE